MSWIITRQERKIFLELPEPERAAFIEEFWKRRDPDPENEENGFRDEYEKRAQEAARLFRGESKAGWLTDRGRILILFGPPDDRRVYPGGTGPGTACYEEWSYGEFPVLFVDRDCTGDYRLETTELSSLRSVNLMYMHELNKSLAASLSAAGPQERLFDFGARLHVATRTAQRLSGTVQLRLPLDQLTFSSEGDTHRCQLDVRLEIRDGRNQTVWEAVSAPQLELKSSALAAVPPPRHHSLDLPFLVSDPNQLRRLREGECSLQVTVTVRADGRTLQKKLALK